MRELKASLGNECVICIVGNKCDLVSSREIPYAIGQAFADRHNMKFVETSAKESENVEKIFNDIAEPLLKQANEMYPNKSNARVLLEKPTTAKISGMNCCST